MKKLPFYIAVGVAVAAIAALIYSQFKSGNIALSFGSGSKTPDSPAPVLKGYTDTINLRQTLSDDAPNATNEIIVLQNIINSQYPGSVNVTGTYDSDTANMVTQITGKATTNLYEILFIDLAPNLTSNEANALLLNS